MKNLSILFLLLIGLTVDGFTVARAERPQPPPMNATMQGFSRGILAVGCGGGDIFDLRLSF